MRKRILSYLTAILLCQVLLFQYVHAVPLTSISSHYDVVFAVDNSLEMLNYDGLGDFSWMDAFVGVMEQVSDNSSFAVLTKDSTLEFGTLEETETLLYEIPAYNGTSNPVQLLQAAVSALEDRENGNKKMIVLSVASWYNQSELMSLIANTRQQGIKVVLVAFAKDEQTIVEIQSADEEAIITLDVRDLSFNMGDLYAELVEEKESAVSEGAAMVMNTNSGTNASPEYKTAFRTSKHIYTFDNTNNRKESAGAYFSLLLNMYYLLPSYCTDGSDGYDMYYADSAADDNQVFLSTTAYSIGKGNSSEMFVELIGSDANKQENINVVIDELLHFWNKQVNIILSEEPSNLCLSESSISELRDEIQENLKRRLPVFVSIEKTGSTVENYLIVGTDYSGNYKLFDSSNNSISISNSATFSDASDIKIIDTAQYFNMVRGTYYIDDSSSDLPGVDIGKQITIKTPPEYTEPLTCIHFGPTNVSVVSANVGSVVFEAKYSTKEQAVDNVMEFPISIKVTYDGYVPNCYRSTLNYVIRLYDDMTNPNDWYYDYVFDLTNQGIIHGIKVDATTYKFQPNNNMTLKEYVTILYFAADIQEMFNGSDVKDDPDDIVTHAYAHGFITDDQLDRINDEKRLTEKNTTRQEAADILWKIFQSDLCRVPHFLTPYSNFEDSPFAVSWDALLDVPDVESEEDNVSFDAMKQLFANGVMVGDNNKNMNPTGNLTRAQTCVLISKSLFKLSEFGSIIDPYLPAPDATAEVNVTYSNQEFSEYGGKGYTVNILEDGIYRLINNSPEVRMYLYRDKKEILPQYDCYALTKDSENVLYLSGENEDRGAFKLQKEEFTISNVNYNNSTPKLGINNVVTLDIEKNTAGTGVYKVALYCASDSTSEGGMRSVSKTVTLNGTESSTVTFEDVALYGGGSGQIYTYVKVALFNDVDGYLAKSHRIDDMIDGILPQKLNFEKVLTTEGKNHYYLFDDNYEKIRDCDLADGTVPTTIANFGVLESGIYTFFGYHNIDHSQFTKDHLYYEPVFYNTSSDGKVTMRKIGYSTLWDWNQVWADFSGKKVLMPEYYNSQVDGNEKLSGERNPTQNKYSYETKDVNIGTKLWFSDFLIPDENGYSQISEITENTIWIMMEFEVIEGSVIFETLAYSDKARKNNIDIANIAKGNYEPDRQYKGTAYNAPCVSVDLNYCIDDSVFETGKNVVGLPLEIKNQFFENWYQPYTLTAELPGVTNRFTTHVNSYTLNNWRTAVENDIVVLNYEDDDGTMWIFNCERSDQAPNGILPKTNNGPLEDMLGLAGNFANFGVSYTYTIRISNTSQTSKYFCFDVLSQGNHIYDYTISYSNSDVLIQSDQTLKIVDLAGDIDKWDSIVENVELRPGTETTIVLNLTMTTACNSTIQNYLYVKKEL